ncbi:hypothetical protein D3C81_1840460 [compost metagenome]
MGGFCLPCCDNDVGIILKELFVGNLRAVADTGLQILVQLVLRRKLMSAPDIGMPQQPFYDRVLGRPVYMNGSDHINGMKMDSQLIGEVGYAVLNRP